MEAKNICIQPVSPFNLLLAPPAWGKTSLILDLVKRQEGLWIFVSPLRALANEFYERAKECLNTCLIQSQKDLNMFYQQEEKKKYQIVVGTPEVFGDSFFENYVGKRARGIIIDEVHLFHSWGKSFRPYLLDSFYLCLSVGIPVLGLSATIEDALIKQLKHECLFAGVDLQIEDYGNFKLLNEPNKFYFYTKFGRSALLGSFTKIIKKKESDDCHLLFCETRSEVDYWLDYCARHKIEAIGCVGGKVKEFQDSLKKSKNLRVIVSTTVLSHGVNLPEIRNIFISYQVKDHAMWIQMIGRGGRKGEEFNVFSLESYDKSYWKNIKLLLKTYYKKWLGIED